MEAQKGVIMTTRTTRRSKKVRASLYVIVGTLLILATISFAIYMWFSGTFLANMWVTRKIIYVVLIVFFVAGIWLVNEGTKYLSKNKKKGR